MHASLVLLDVKQVAERLNVRPKRVYELRIPFIKLSTRCYRWRERDVEQWLESQRSALPN